MTTVPYEQAQRMSNGRLVPGQTLVKDGRVFTVVPNVEGSQRPVRKHIPDATRNQILIRDRGTCRYCGRFDTAMEIDHVVPVALGGSNRKGNLVAACRDCNSLKGVQLWKPRPLWMHMNT